MKSHQTRQFAQSSATCNLQQGARKLKGHEQGKSLITWKHVLVLKHTTSLFRGPPFPKVISKKGFS